MGQLTKLYEVLSRLFESRDIDRSDLDWIIVEVLKIKRSELKIDRQLSVKEIRKIYKLAKKRYKGKPLSQVLKKSSFYGLDFYVNKNCLSPRPETELLVEAVINGDSGNVGLDIGTGSGAIAITLSELAGKDMTAVDISNKALKVARKNAKQHKQDIGFIKSNLFSRVPKTMFDFIVSNPPYIKTIDIQNLDVEVKNHEPLAALDGGETGLDFYKKIIEQSVAYLKSGGHIYFELGIGQSGDVRAFLEKDFKDIKIIKDYNKIDRIIKATKK